MRFRETAIAPLVGLAGIILLVVLALGLAHLIRYVIASWEGSAQLLLLTKRRITPASIYREFLRREAFEMSAYWAAEIRHEIAISDYVDSEATMRLIQDLLDQMKLDESQEDSPTSNELAGEFNAARSEYESLALVRLRRPGSWAKVARSGRIAEAIFEDIYPKGTVTCPT